MTALVIRAESGRFAGRTTTGAPLVLVSAPFAYLFETAERGAAETIAANLTASWGEACSVVDATELFGVLR